MLLVRVGGQAGCGLWARCVMSPRSFPAFRNWAPRRCGGGAPRLPPSLAPALALTPTASLTASPASLLAATRGPVGAAPAPLVRARPGPSKGQGRGPRGVSPQHQLQLSRAAAELVFQAGKSRDPELLRKTVDFATQHKLVATRGFTVAGMGGAAAMELPHLVVDLYLARLTHTGKPYEKPGLFLVTKTLLALPDPASPLRALGVPGAAGGGLAPRGLAFIKSLRAALADDPKGPDAGTRPTMRAQLLRSLSAVEEEERVGTACARWAFPSPRTEGLEGAARGDGEVVDRSEEGLRRGLIRLWGLLRIPRAAPPRVLQPPSDAPPASGVASAPAVVGSFPAFRVARASTVGPVGAAPAPLVRARPGPSKGQGRGPRATRGAPNY